MSSTATYPHINLTPLPRDVDGSRVRFDCGECDHTEVFVRLVYTDVAHVLANSHYWGECPAVRWRGEQDTDAAAHLAKMLRRHRPA